MKTAELRRKFLNYFKQQAHTIVPSSPVIPHDDPTLLFINAGMNQFKDVFLGEGVRDYTRASTSQKCIRVGGKHNDLENVGHTKSHLTFFEMLGNFSFGDYFKEEAIKFAWEVSTEVLEFDEKRLWPTVFNDDDEAFEIWTRYVPVERITRMGEKTNFWEMGDTGPCGPCSEILYDRGPAYGDGATPLEDVKETRFLEFWNLVFMQYNRLSRDNTQPLPKPSIDTGAGLERLLVLKNETDTVFETDVLRSLIAEVENLSKKPYESSNHHTAAAFRVIADHLRCLAFAISDGVQPSNVERGYILRKVLRRAVRYGRQLGLDRPFLGKIYPRLVKEMGEDYPELKVNESRIEEILTIEEEGFLKTLKRGGNLLNQIIESSQEHGNLISGDDAFKLKDTYGFPVEEIQLIAIDAGLHVDMERYNALEHEAKERSRKAHKTTSQVASESVFADFVEKNGPTQFTGYDSISTRAGIVAMMVDGDFVSKLQPGEEATILLDSSPFYAEMGGQVGDKGTLQSEGALFEVNDTQMPYKGAIAHIGKLAHGELRVDSQVTATVDDVRRQKIANNHTATHLLHWALCKVLGEHVKQAGSVVDSSKLRFDFSHHKALTTEEIRHIEDLVNGKIRQNTQVASYELSYDDAQKSEDIKQFFGEKYGSKVRVIDIDFSKELCGGTHTSQTGNIGYFRIVSESSISAGVRRITAVTGSEAEAFSREPEEMVFRFAELLKTHPGKVEERVEKLVQENANLEQKLKQFSKQSAKALVDTLLNKVESSHAIPHIISQVEASSKELKECIDQLAERMPSGVAVLASIEEGKCQVLIRVSDDLVSKGVNAKELITSISPIIQGGGGGKPNAAQAGGKAPENLQEAFEKIQATLNTLNVTNAQ